MSTTDTTEARATLSYRGVPVTLDLFTLDAEALAQIERRVERLLARDGWSAPTAPATQVARPAPDAGGLCCPVHGPSKVRQGKRGYFCAAKRADGEYCTEKPQ